MDPRHDLPLYKVRCYFCLHWQPVHPTSDWGYCAYWEISYPHSPNALPGLTLFENGDPTSFEPRPVVNESFGCNRIKRKDEPVSLPALTEGEER